MRAADTGFFRWLFGALSAAAIITGAAIAIHVWPREPIGDADIWACYGSARYEAQRAAKPPCNEREAYACYGPLALEAIRGNYKPC